MKIITQNNSTLVAFNEDYTEATLSRANNKIHRIHIRANKFTMQKLEQIANLDDDSFIGLSDIQAKLREIRNEN